MIWVICACAVYLIGLCFLWVTNDVVLNDDDPIFILLVFTWPITLFYVVILVACDWVVQGLRKIWGFFFE